MSIPADFLACEATTSDSSAPVVATDSGWLAHTNEIGVPAGIPAPHSPDPDPGFWQVVVPPGTTFQPWAFSTDTALDGLNGYGAVVALAGAYGEVGADGVGPYAG